MLHYFDRASMACSLEVRVPFLDHELVEACARIPGSAKVRRLRGKHVLRLAAAGLVPDFVLTKRKRGFFNEAVGTWLGARDGALVDRLLLDTEARYTSVLDRAGVERTVREWRAGGRHGSLVLALMMLELWLRTYVPRAFEASGAAGRVAA
jgi:asparagine synthase (glutamine-hydrolysing)